MIEGFDVDNDGVADTIPAGTMQTMSGIDDNFDTDPANGVHTTDPNGM
jgi:hypothetical protein